MIHPEQFMGKYVIQGHIRCVTGLHIGGTDTGIEIGGLDNAVIRDQVNNRPYIPGSSLKGKLRMMLEWSLGLIAPHSKHKSDTGTPSFAAYECLELKTPREEAENPTRWDYAYSVGRLFGAATDEEAARAQAGPTRLTVRDAFLNEDSALALERVLGAGTFTEIKTENTLDRVTSAANPRPMERVPAGAVFDFTLIVDVYQEADRALLKDLFGVLALLEDSGLGGNVSRGHGQVAIEGLQAEWRSRDYYFNKAAAKPIAAAQGKGARDLAATFDVQDWQ